MRGATLAKAKSRSASVPIEHLRYAEPKESAEFKRIREINKALEKGARANIREMNQGRPANDHHGRPTESTRLLAFKLRSGPVAMLLNERRIGGEEFTAAQEFEKAFMAVTAGLGFKPLSMERVDGGPMPDWPEDVTRAVRRYTEFVKHWSQRRTTHNDQTLTVLVMAVIDHRPFSVIEADVGMRHGKAATVVVRALRDYAARAGWAGHETRKWKMEAAESYPNQVDKNQGAEN
jgi:hypothetical protein